MLPPRGYIFIGLNIVRMVSILASLLVLSSCIVTMVKDVDAVNQLIEAQKTNSTLANTLLDCDYVAYSTVPNEPAGEFWAVLNLLLIIFQAIALILSEIGWPAAFFNRFFPVLGSEFGLGPLGVIQCLIGASILSHHVNDFSLVSSFFLFSVGCLNILIGLIFREKGKTKRSVTSWRDHAKSVLPPPVQRAASSASTLWGPNFSEKKGSTKDLKDLGSRFAGYGFGRRGENEAGKKGFLISKPVEALPRYAPRGRLSMSTLLSR